MEGKGLVLWWLFDRLVGYSLLYGVVHTTPELAGVACELPPGDSHPTLGRLDRID
jgi:hypothetical protein